MVSALRGGETSSVSVVLSSSAVGLVSTVSLVIGVWWSSSISRSDVEGFIEPLASGIILLSEFLAVKPFEMTGMHCVFPGFEGHPWVLWVVSLTSDYSLDKCWFKTLFEQVDGSMVVKFDSRCRGKSFKFSYEYVEAFFLFESGELIKCFIFPVGIGEGIFEVLFKGNPMIFVCFVCSCGKACLKFDHLFFLPWFRHVSLHKCETGGDACSHVAHSLILLVGKMVYGKCDKEGMALLPVSIEGCWGSSFKSSIRRCGDHDGLPALAD